MKRVFTLAAISAICACGLVIDADKLVESNGADPAMVTDGATETGSSSGDSGGADAPSDVGADVIQTVEVPECVPPKPANAEGPYAVVSGAAGAPFACPAGYLATPNAQAKSSLSADPTQCNDASACACGGGGSGTPKCGLRMRYYNDSACTQEADTPGTVNGFCTPLDSENYGKVEAAVSGVTCAASTGAATTTPTAKPTPSFKSETIVCSPDPSVTTAQCKAGLVPLPAAKNADACIVVATNQSCSGTGYSFPRDLSKVGTFTDTRTCNCGCAASAASCTGGSVNVSASALCTAGTTNVSVGTCHELKDTNSDYALVYNAPSPGTAQCSTRASAGGTVSPTIDLRLCCLSGSGGGGG